MEYIVPILGDGINPQYYCQYLEIRCQSPAAAEGGGPGVDASPGVLGLGTCVSLTACFGAARFSYIYRLLVGVGAPLVVTFFAMDTLDVADLKQLLHGTYPCAMAGWSKGS